MKNINKILAVILAVLTIAVLAVGCSSASAEVEPPRFTYEYAEDTPGTGYIITDTVTGAQYLYIDGGYDGGMVKLEPITQEEEPQAHPYAADAEYIAKTIWGEARGCSKTEQAAVAWCILNRVDSEDPYYPDDIISVITQKNQFDGYDPSHPVTDEHYNLALEVIDLWLKEDGVGIVAGRVLPKEYMWFKGDGDVNVFRDAYEGKCNIWDWSLASPY